MSAPVVGASVSPSFAQLTHDLRDGIIEHYEQLGEQLDTPAGLMTLDTNSVLAAGRGRLLLRLLAEAGTGSIAGWHVLDLDAGFGAFALYCAHLGADVVAADPDEQRMQVAVAIAARRGLAVRALAARAQELPLPDASFDLVIANNSLCYILEEAQRRLALSEIHRVLRPGGWLVTRNPNRLHPRDRFTGLPLLGLLAPTRAQRMTDAPGRQGSNVRLHSRGAMRELRRAGFTQVRRRAQPGRVPGARFADYHVLARRPAAADVPVARPEVIPSPASSPPGINGLLPSSPAPVAHPRRTQ